MFPDNIIRIVRNIGWLGADKALRLIIGFAVYVWVVKYLGAEQLGLWNYCIAFASLFVVFSNLGLDDIVIRELVRNKEDAGKILATSFFLKVIASFITFIIIVVSFSIYKRGNGLELLLVGIYSAGYIFQSIYVINLFFRSIVLSKFPVIASDVAFIIFSIIKLLLISSGASLVSFAVASLFEFVATALFMIAAYKINGMNFKSWTFDKKIALKLLHDGFPLIFFGVSIMLLIRVDQLMIGSFLGNKSVGLYSIAVRITEVSAAFPAMLINSLFPAVINAKSYGGKAYEKRIRNYLSIVFISSAILVVPIWYWDIKIIYLVFGDKFQGVGSALSILIWSSIFSSIALASKNIFVSEGMQIHVFLRTIIALAINIYMNLLLIPKYGISGAAASTLIAQIVLSYFYDLFFIKTRHIFYIKSKSIFIPKVEIWQYIKR